MASNLTRFRVAGFDDESGRFDQPTEVRCGVCGASRQFTYRDDGGDDYSESLSVMASWAAAHQCEEAS